MSVANPTKPRLLVLTDISSLTAGVREPDDGQSMIRLMLYGNQIDLDGLCATSNMGHGQVCRPELIEQVIDAYEQVQPNLQLHDPAYPPASSLRRVVKAGQPGAGPKVPVFDSIGEGKGTEASEWIIRCADRDDPRPLWIAVWGGTADLAQALWTVRQTRPAEAVDRFVARLRVHSVYDQDSTGAWIKQQFPSLFYITRHHGIRGMYRGGDTSLVSCDWVERHVRYGHGALGSLYPNYRGGDVWSETLGGVQGLKEGDTPSYLNLIPNGLSDPARPNWHPAWGGWGGRFEGSGSRFVDTIDHLPGIDADPDPRMAAVYRWRPAFQADFQARLDWCVKPFGQANHPPLAIVEGPLDRTARAGESLLLDALASRDPDGNTLSFQWEIDPHASTCAFKPILEDATTPRAQLTVPPVSEPQTLHVLLTVTDDGDPPLRAYQRVVITIRP